MESTGSVGAAGAEAPVASSLAPPRPFTGAFEHTVDEKNRLVLPAPFRARLAPGAYLGKLDGCLGLWPLDEYDKALQRLDDAVGMGLVAEAAAELFVASTFAVQPDGQGRVVVNRDLRSFADLSGPVVVVGARHRIGIWASERWNDRVAALPEGPDAALRQVARDLKL